MLREQNVTALYRRFESADLVRAALRNDGMELARIHVVPDRVSGIDDATDLKLYDSILADLDLSEADTQTYQDAVRRGDFVVSVTCESSVVPRVEEIMRHPEAIADRVEDGPIADAAQRRTIDDPIPAAAAPLSAIPPFGR